jgi:hypothetical protein
VTPETQPISVGPAYCPPAGSQLEEDALQEILGFMFDALDLPPEVRRRIASRDLFSFQPAVAAVLRSPAWRHVVDGTDCARKRYVERMTPVQAEEHAALVRSVLLAEISAGNNLGAALEQHDRDMFGAFRAYRVAREGVLGEMTQLILRDCSRAAWCECLDTMDLAIAGGWAPWRQWRNAVKPEKVS